MQRPVEFNSKGSKVRGILETPKKGKGPFPIVVMAGGWCYVKEIVMPHYAKKIVDAGLAVLRFDYRCFGESEGEPRQHIDPWAQIEDYKNAISFVMTQSDVDPNRVGIWGISYSGGHVLIVGATDPRVHCIVSNIPVVDGFANMRRVHGERRFDQLMKAIMDDRVQRSAGKAGGYMAMSAPDPDNTLCTWPFAHVHEIFMNIKEKEAPRHEHRNTIESTEILLNYTVFPYVPRILNTPTLMVVAENDNITLWDLEIAAYNGVAAGNKKLVVLPDVTHMSLYSKLSHLETASTEGAAFLKTHLLA
ncbi:MAG: peptidase S15 [Acidobacteria bacterium RIFCSPLOWO2_12_FULL_67_14]|nr:MAG: peptidase S15 [Acidobacteria bacterium RIFCSPLOWO2_12_FULL_67_14]